MLRKAAAALLSLAGMALAADVAAAEAPLVAIAPSLVDGTPEVHTRVFHGHQAWSFFWLRDARRHEVQILFIEGLNLPYREHPEEMVDLADDKSSPDAAELTLDLQGRAETIWGRDVFWLLTSELAVMEADAAKPETMADGELHRGTDRRVCVVFTTDPAPRQGTLIGNYCQDLPPETEIDAATARQWLDDLALRID